MPAFVEDLARCLVDDPVGDQGEGAPAEGLGSSPPELTAADPAAEVIRSGRAEVITETADLVLRLPREAREARPPVDPGSRSVPGR